MLVFAKVCFIFFGQCTFDLFYFLAWPLSLPLPRHPSLFLVFETQEHGVEFP